ncbi:hypothetical protein GCM10027346_17570 [Hymenobacter seoulensis]
MQAVIPVGVEYAQLLEDVRAVVRHELTQRTASSTTVAAPVDELLTVREAATLLDVTQQTVHEWKRRGLLKYHKLGQRTYLKRADVLAALQGCQRSVKKGR